MDTLIFAIVGSEITQIMKYEKYIDARITPTQLFHEISKKEGKQQFVSFIKLSQTPLQKIRALSIMGLMIIHSNQYYEFVDENLVECDPLDDGWISKQLINPFSNWLKRCCETQSQFSKLKSVEFENADLMFQVPYIINLLTSILKIVQNIPKFGRYFDLDAHNRLFIMFSEVILTIVNLMYSRLKRSLQFYLIQEELGQIFKNKDIIKWIFADILPQMNEVITSVTLNKYFKFYQKGIVTKMIRIREFDADSQQILNNILQQNCQDSNELRQQQLSTLQSQIFPEDGSFNQNLFLSSLSSFEQSGFKQLTNVCITNKSKHKQTKRSLKQNLYAA